LEAVKASVAVGSKGRAESTFDHTFVCITLPLLMLPPLLLLLLLLL
jgi:hypothetical protein